MNFGECGICDQGVNKGKACTCCESARSGDNNLAVRQQLNQKRIEEVVEINAKYRALVKDIEQSCSHDFTERRFRNTYNFMGDYIYKRECRMCGRPETKATRTMNCPSSGDQPCSSLWK